MSDSILGAPYAGHSPETKEAIKSADTIYFFDQGMAQKRDDGTWHVLLPGLLGEAEAFVTLEQKPDVETD